MTADTILKSLNRELGLRLRVYPRRVLEAKMTQEAADHEIEAMRAAIACITEAKQAIAHVIATNNLPECGIEQAEEWQAEFNPPPPPPAQRELF